MHIYAKIFGYGCGVFKIGLSQVAVICGKYRIATIIFYSLLMYFDISMENNSSILFLHRRRFS